MFNFFGAELLRLLKLELFIKKKGEELVWKRKRKKMKMKLLDF